jgi:hypothetical protein
MYLQWMSWKPNVNWDHFNQGDLHARFWRPFTELIRLCHSYKHWDEAAKYARRERLVRPLYPESRYGRAKRKQEQASQIGGHEDHKFRAAFLAAEKIGQMQSLFPDSTFPPEGPEWKCYVALRCAIDPYPRHERGHYRAGAFNTFDARAELVGDPFPIAQRWRAAVGDPLS